MFLYIFKKDIVHPLRDSISNLDFVSSSAPIFKGPRDTIISVNSPHIPV